MNNTLYATSASGIFANQKQQWLGLNEGLHGIFTTSITAASNDNIIAASNSSRVLLSKDDGTNWEFVDQNLPYDFAIEGVNPLIADPNSNAVYMRYGTTIYVSPDAGQNWQNISPDPTPVFGSAVDAMTVQNGAVYLGYGEGGAAVNQVAKSTDQGNSWQQFPVLPESIEVISNLAVVNNILYAAGVNSR